MVRKCLSYLEIAQLWLNNLSSVFSGDPDDPDHDDDYDFDDEEIVDEIVDDPDVDEEEN